MRVGAFAPQVAFLPALARLWLDEAGGAHSNDGILLLPSRRAAQALAGAFLEQNSGCALLLPRIIAIGAVDEAGLSLAGALSLPPAVAPLHRQAMLAKLILSLRGADGAPQKLAPALALAADLAALLDEADYAEVNLAETLPGLVVGDLANHWQTTLKFLRIITTHWPAILAGLSRMNPAARQVALLDAQNAAWQQSPPGHRVWMVAAQGTPAISRLARTIAALPQGLLLLPGYDATLDSTTWDACDDGHAQGGIARLLGTIGARREEVEPLPAPPATTPDGRARLFSQALLPATALGQWQKPTTLDITGLYRLEAQDEAQNATAIAMTLRDALQTPGRTAALITPDRGLALRVTAALRRFGITADDSAGEPLAQSPPATLLRLLARAMVAEYAPLPLLALLKHPLSAAGLPPETCREHARQLECQALRGPRPQPGLAGIKYRLENQGNSAERDFLARLELRLRPLALPMQCHPAAALRALIAAGEAMAQTPELPGAAALWSGEAGVTLSQHLLEALEALEGLPEIAPGELADLLDAVLTGVVVRKPRSKDGHPRVAIWGVQEAALQQVDVAVLGGLVEGVWPGIAEPGPWLSRPMRHAAGLPSPEQKIGQAAHDFFALCCACPQVVLAAPSRRARAPAVPARWLTRLEALLNGAKTPLPRHAAAGWAGLLDLPTRRIQRARPRPRPPAEARSKIYSVSDLTTLIADPYAVYARKILKIHPLDELDAESDPSLFGEIVHAGLAAFFALPGALNQPAAEQALNTALQTAMRQGRPRAALEHWWAARLSRIADWVVAHEQPRRKTKQDTPTALAPERSAELELPGGFILKARADRIERSRENQISIIDYKTGTTPTAEQVKSGTAPQLPLEAIMAEAGVFGPEFTGKVGQLTYIRLSGRAEAGEEKPLFASEPETLREVINDAAIALPTLLLKFAQGETPYLAAPHPGRENPYDPFAGLSRRAEWADDPDDASLPT